MKLIISFILCYAVLHITASEVHYKRKDNINSVEDGMLGFGLELLLIKLEAMEHRLQKMENRIEQSHKEMFTTIQKLERKVALSFSEIRNLTQEKVHTTLHKLDKDLGNVLEIQQSAMPSSCKDISSKVSRTYLIRVKSASTPFKVYCEQKSFGGGWIVFQYRYDGSLDFYRGWNEFRDGFGDLNKEFWLGLEKIHQITSGRKHELIVELKNFNGTYKYVRYDAFELGSESDQYDVKNIGKYSGTVGGEASFIKGSKFATKDRHIDEIGGQCARRYEGAWWYTIFCAYANLNGRYMNDINEKSMHWYYFKDNQQGLSYSRMMIREVE
ncbi:fibrinogen-like protein A [Anopheles darlingi]|uniref:fibrinogen-like protein A n=1 Tax=Anopheles darlingi TaxID=43151 RepID=UPI0021002C38|nr:fibrinogen-like protein A [Anopheles darlingi]